MYIYRVVIISSGHWSSGETGAALTAHAFEISVPNNLGADLVSVCLAFFAYSTLLGWSYYGEKSIVYILKERAVVPYRLVFAAIVLVGAVIQLDIVWAFADIMNGLMAFPNLVGLLLLSRVVVEETKRYLPAELKR